MGEAARGTSSRRLFWWGGATAAVLVAIFLWREAPSPLTSLLPEEFEKAFARDAKRYLELDAGMESALDFLGRRDTMFEKGDAHVLDPEEEKALLEAATALFDCGIALDQIRLFYEDWYRFDPWRAERGFHLRSYLLTYAAELSLYEKSTRAVRLVTKNANAVKFLDAPHAELGLAAGSFTRFRQDLQGFRDGARYRAGSLYLAWLEKGLNGRAESEALGCAWLWKRVEEHLDRIGEMPKAERALATLGSDLQWARQGLRKVWFPVQSKVAEWMGDTKLRRVGRYLIARKQQEEMAASLEPGDILLSRKNWYLSNVGLPGFWPHAILYVGEPGKIDAYFADPAVQAWVQEQGAPSGSFREFLGRRFPGSWSRYEAGEAGDPFRVIEAVSEGVVMNALAHASGDYLVALRPRLSKLAKAQAIAKAFSYLGRPYDFDFDFATDHALVCTEVVWRSYRPAAGKEGLDFPLVEVLGRRTLPANEIARVFAEERGKPGARLDFVLFLDAKEKERRAFVSTEEEFAKSVLRPKWDISQR